MLRTRGPVEVEIAVAGAGTFEKETPQLPETAKNPF